MAKTVALGALGKLIPALPGGCRGVVSPESREAALLARIAKETEKLSRLAFEEGIKAAEVWAETNKKNKGMRDKRISLSQAAQLVEDGAHIASGGGCKTSGCLSTLSAN